MKDIQNIVTLLLVVVLFSTGYVLYTTLSNDDQEETAAKEIVGWCGTSHPSTFTAAGKKLFKMNCATCHAKNMKSEAVGPPLLGTFDLWKKDTLAYMSYLNNTERYIIDSNNQRLLKLKEDWGDLSSHANILTLQETKEIIAYIEYTFHSHPNSLY